MPAAAVPHPAQHGPPRPSAQPGGDIECRLVVVAIERVRVTLLIIDADHGGRPRAAGREEVDGGGPDRPGLRERRGREGRLEASTDGEGRCRLAPPAERAAPWKICEKRWRRYSS